MFFSLHDALPISAALTSYAENIKNNVDELNDPSITFRNPFLAFTSEEILANRLVEEFKDIPAEEVKAAVHKGWEEMDGSFNSSTLFLIFSA